MPAPSQFNVAWYLANNLDVAAAGVDPYEHFLHSGIAEGRTTDTFNENSYLARYPDVAAAVARGDYATGWEHYVAWGSAELRDASGPLYLQGASAADALSAAGTSKGATIRGFGGADTLTGSMGADLIYGNQNLDYLYGGYGDDTIYGGQNDGPAGSDGIQRQGAETIVGGQGRDLIYGNFGADRIDLSDSEYSDTVYGGQDNDTIVGVMNGDMVYGNLGDDRIEMSYLAGQATLYGGGGADIVEPIGRPFDLYWKDFNPEEGDRISASRLVFYRDNFGSYDQFLSFDPDRQYLYFYDPIIRGGFGIYVGRSDFSEDWFVGL